MKIIFSKQDFVFFLVKLAHFCVLFNSVLITFGAPYLYVGIMILIIIITLLLGVRGSNIKKFVFHFIYIFILFTLMINHVLTLEMGAATVTAIGIYTLPIICWVILLSRFDGEKYRVLFKNTYILSVLVAGIGIIQYFFSPGLFGFIPTDSKSIEWAINKSFWEYAVFFRATSTLGSPQVFGLFCVLNVIISDRFKGDIPRKTFIIGTIILTIGGSLSGNKLFFLILLGYYLLVNIPKLINNIKSMLSFIVVFCLFSTTLFFFSDKVPILERVFSADSVIEQEKNDSRIDRYEYILSNTNIVQGNGLGSITNRSNKDLTAAESYIFKVYYEAGVFAFFSLLILLATSGILSLTRSYRDGLIMFFIFISLVIVHAFESPVFFIVWGYILSLCVMKNRSNYNEHPFKQ